MWLVSPRCFLSVVQHRDHADVLIVRARRKNDLFVFLPDLRPSDIVSHAGTDYPHRVFVARGRFARAQEAFIRTELTYPNMKGAVPGWDRQRHTIYMRVWTALSALNDTEPRDRTDDDDADFFEWANTANITDLRAVEDFPFRRATPPRRARAQSPARATRRATRRAAARQSRNRAADDFPRPLGVTEAGRAGRPDPVSDALTEETAMSKATMPLSVQVQLTKAERRWCLQEVQRWAQETADLAVTLPPKSYQVTGETYRQVYRLLQTGAPLPRVEMRVLLNIIRAARDTAPSGLYTRVHDQAFTVGG